MDSHLLEAVGEPRVCGHGGEGLQGELHGVGLHHGGQQHRQLGQSELSTGSRDRGPPTTAHLDRAEDGGGRGGGGGGHGQEGGGAHAVAHVAHLTNQRRGLRSRDCSPPITAHLAARDARALPQSRGQVQRGVLVHTEPGQMWLQKSGDIKHPFIYYLSTDMLSFYDYQMSMHIAY